MMNIEAEIRLAIETYSQRYVCPPAAVLMDAQRYESLCRLMTERNSYSMQYPVYIKEVLGFPITIAPAEIGSCLACLHPGDPQQQAARVSEAALRGLAVQQRRVEVE